MVGVANVLDKKTEGREEIRRRKAKDGANVGRSGRQRGEPRTEGEGWSEVAGEQFKTKTTKLDKI